GRALPQPRGAAPWGPPPRDRAGGAARARGGPPPAAPDVAAAAAEPEAASSPVAAYLEDPAAITAGRRMFRAVCTGYCHSTTPGVTKDAPNLFDCNWDHGNTDADLYRVINQGVPDTEMLPFEGKIPEDTIWKVIAYVRSNSLDCG
ncbi:MAG: cytochrome c, partial [Holophagales bacterium]|nr:cytochrome c [Holophagales bacterium]